MKQAFIFPGQASQYVGMGKDLYDNYRICKETFDRANEILGFDISNICFKGPEDELKQTNITQPAIFIHSIAVFRVLKSMGKLPFATAGHSLGEYSALVAAGALSFEDGLKLVHKRGELMHKAGTEQPGAMAAIIGLVPEKVLDLCDSLRNEGVIQPANYNSPGQIAISGDVNTIRKAIEIAPEMGALKAIELVVSGAFHSPLMANAAEGLAEALNATTFNDAEVPVYSNVKAKPVQNRNDVRDLLLQQLTNPVLWQQIIENMIDDGYDQFYEIGPGKVLRGLVKRINRNVNCREIGTVVDLEKLGDR
ncbi:MAG: ACP S-malonyltransferase [Calditrichaceae bacterium]|nr:ACP S-malonyltransferase [Calditrichaceae bacterium]